MFNSQQKRGAMQTLFGLLLTAVNSALFALVWFMYYRTKMYIYPFFIKGDVIVVLLFALLFYMFAHLYSGFDVVFQTAAEMMYSNTVAAVISCGIMYVITALLIRAVPNVLPMLVLVVGCVAMSGLLSFCVKKATARFLPPRATLLVYGNPEARKEGEDILRRLPGAFYVLDSISADVGSEELCRQIFRWDARAVMLCGVPSSERNDLLKYCIDRNIEAYVRPNIGDLLVKGARAMQLDNLPVLVCHRSSPAIWYLALKRLTDILLSLAALVVFSPFMLITAIAIKLYDGGPILYKQLRLTKDGKQFYIYKFRSMRVDAEKDGVARLAQEHDDRITPVGKIIRAIRIDETPQLFCILVGDMSIVGPRPVRPEIAEDYELEMPEFALRLQAKAGLTGLAQVYGKYNTTPYNKLQMDLQYIASMGVVEDLKIMFATVKILFMPESTEGVADGQTTAKADEEEKKTAT